MLAALIREGWTLCSYPAQDKVRNGEGTAPPTKHCGQLVAAGESQFSLRVQPLVGSLRSSGWPKPRPMSTWATQTGVDFS